MAMVVLRGGGRILRGRCAAAAGAAGWGGPAIAIVTASVSLRWTEHPPRRGLARAATGVGCVPPPQALRGGPLAAAPRFRAGPSAVGAPLPVPYRGGVPSTATPPAPVVVFVWDVEPIGRGRDSRMGEIAIHESILSCPPLPGRERAGAALSTLVCPEQSIPGRATATRGIRLDVAGGPPFAKVWQQARAFVASSLNARGDGAVALFVAHGAQFDCRMLGYELGRLAPDAMMAAAAAAAAGIKRTKNMKVTEELESAGLIPAEWRFVCSMPLFKESFPNESRYALQDIASRRGTASGPAHRALSDVTTLDDTLQLADKQLRGGLRTFYASQLYPAGGGGNLASPPDVAGPGACPLRRLIVKAMAEQSRPRATELAPPPAPLAALPSPAGTPTPAVPLSWWQRLWGAWKEWTQAAASHGDGRQPVGPPQ
ncbi:hypothetical protein I4F81_008837 [Pyropia yezoensis]|uniref:Uncharacterized protein n=1 Tax=Pyropia yezoensis TaxID=2788 RepID=A0ACC3C809_PYRYE|nr:hypothetical protein I4F81_008837 [Neopyropia yezoensis]